MGIIYSAIAIFGMVAIVGMYLLSLIMRNKETPKAVTIIHGLFAVLAVVLLVIYCFTNHAGPLVSIVIFIIAAMGGVIVNYKDLTGKKAPKWLAIAHGLVAVIGFAFLLAFAFFS